MTGPRRAFCLVIVLLSAFVTEVAGQSLTSRRRYEIELLTVSPGDDAVTMFGHSALRVIDRRKKTDRVFNWGTIQFSPDLAQRFVAGHLVYYLGVESFERALGIYRKEDRRVVGQVLDLTPLSAVRLVQAVEQNAEPAHREYAYHHFDDNCATKTRDLIDEYSDGALRKVADGPSERTFRHHLYQVGAPPAEMVFGLDLTTNAILDRPTTHWQALFLSQNLHDAVGQAKTADGARPLVHAARVHLERQGPPIPRVSVRPGWPIYGLSALLLLIALGASAWSRPLPTVESFGLMSLGLVAGLGGVLAVGLWIYSDLDVFHLNQCLIHLWPTDLALIVLGPMALSRGGRVATGLSIYLIVHAAISAVALLLLAIGVFQQQLWPMAAPNLVACMAAAAILWRARPRLLARP